MQDTPTHKHTKPAVRLRLVVVLAFCLCVAMAVPSTTAEVVSVIRFELFRSKFLRPNEVNVNHDDQIVFRGINNDSPLHIQFSSSCADDRIKSGLKVQDGQNINVSDLFNKTSSATAFAAFESIGCKDTQTVKITLLDPPPPPKNSGKNAPPKTDGKNSTGSPDNAHAKNGTESGDDDGDRSVNPRPNPGGDNQKSGGSLSNKSNRNVTNDNKDDLSPVAAAVVGSIATFGFASLCAVGFLFYRRRCHRMMDAATQGGGKDEPSLMNLRNMTPQNTTPQNMIPRNKTPGFSDSGSEAPPVYEAALATPFTENDEKTGLVEAEGNETNHEVVLNEPNCEIVGHMAINT